MSVFFIEYLLRVWTSDMKEGFNHTISDKIRYMFTPLMIIDFLAILPFFFFSATLDLRFLRAFRMVRLLKLFRLSKIVRSANTVMQVINSKKYELAFVASVIGGLVLLSSTLIYMIEHPHQPEAFSSIPASMWWGIITLTTVGYGDMYPISVAGKAVGSFIALLGVAMVALPAGIIVSGFFEVFGQLKEEEEAEVICPHCGTDLKKSKDHSD